MGVWSYEAIFYHLELTRKINPDLIVGIIFYIAILLVYLDGFCAGFLATQDSNAGFSDMKIVGELFNNVFISLAIMSAFSSPNN